jgi:hypothetical protein
MKEILIAISTLFSLTGCTQTKSIFYSYKINSFIIDSTKHLLTSSSFVSYGDYLFEFKNIVHQKTQILGSSFGSHTDITIKFDTIGVYLLSNKSKLYYEFDTFALENKVLKTDKLINKEFGEHFTSSDTLPLLPQTKQYLFSQPSETKINNIKCFYTDVIPKDKTLKDTANVKMLLIKNASLNSIYKIKGLFFDDKDYCIVGVKVSHSNPDEGFIQEIEALRPLTEEEKNICSLMVSKSKNVLTDTIK